MAIYELRKMAGNVWQLAGGELKEPLRYAEEQGGSDGAKRMVGFLAQLTGAEMRIYNEAGSLIETKMFREGVRPGERKLGNP